MNIMNKPHLYAIIPAAGRSTRMGQSKTFLNLPSGQTFYEYLYFHYHHFGCKTLMVVNEEDYQAIESKGLPNLQLIVNPKPELGRLHSLKLGLQHMISPKQVFIHNIDNPFISDELLITLISHKGNHDFIIPEYRGHGGHPILLGEKAINYIRGYSGPDSDLRTILQTLSGTRILFSDKRILFNINTQEDYDSYIRQTT
jgi:CTP:molybdopterin cytidylyltransferase MocA